MLCAASKRIWPQAQPNIYKRTAANGFHAVATMLHVRQDALAFPRHTVASNSGHQSFSVKRHRLVLQGGDAGALRISDRARTTRPSSGCSPARNPPTSSTACSSCRSRRPAAGSGPSTAWLSCWISSGTGPLSPSSSPTSAFLRDPGNDLPALTTVQQRPWERGSCPPGLDDALLFRREGGGWPRLNRMFAGELVGVLQQFQCRVWAA